MTHEFSVCPGGAEEETRLYKEMVGARIKEASRMDYCPITPTLLYFVPGASLSSGAREAFLY